MKGSASVVNLCVAACLAACAGPGVYSPEARVTNAVNDQFLPYEEIVGVDVRQSFGLLSGAWQTVQLLARRDRKTGTLTTHARIRIGYHRTERLRLETARDLNAKVLAMKELAHAGAGCRRAEGCPHMEELLVDIPEPDLRAAQQSGYAFRVYTRPGSYTTFIIMPPLIQALFKGADARSQTAQATPKR